MDIFLKFYGLKEYPFSNAIDNRFYFNSAQHGEALIRLKYAVDTMKGLAVVVGDIGTGKTTLARRMLDELDESQYEAALLIVLHTSVTTDWLMKKIATQLGIKNVGNAKLEILGQLYEKLYEIYESGRKTVVLMDEVQMLQSKEIMEEFRGLLNIEVTEGKLITLILFGLPKLEEQLALDEPLKQRVALKYKLLGFAEDITHGYIKHRLKIAGSEKDIFPPDTIKSVYLYSKGIPRLINTICDNALLESFLIKEGIIHKDIIESVAINLGLNALEEEKVPEIKRDFSSEGEF